MKRRNDRSPLPFQAPVISFGIVGELPAFKQRNACGAALFRIFDVPLCSIGALPPP